MNTGTIHARHRRTALDGACLAKDLNARHKAGHNSHGNRITGSRGRYHQKGRLCAKEYNGPRFSDSSVRMMTERERGVLVERLKRI